MNKIHINMLESNFSYNVFVMTDIKCFKSTLMMQLSEYAVIEW